MLLRIFLTLAILAGLGAGGLAYYEFSTQIPQLQQQRDTEKTDKNTEIAAHNKTKAVLKTTQGELAQTKQELTDTKTQLAKSEARADAQEKRADDLSTKLAKTTEDLKETSDQLAEYKASDLTPDQVVALNKNYKAAQAQIVAINGEEAALFRKYTALKSDYDRRFGLNPVVELPAEMKGKIAVVDPKWDFVVLNIGADQGMLQYGELLVSRDGKLVAKVIVSNVQKDHCIANLIPGWKLGEVIEGDEVTPAHPKST
jgi:hypothetical protein